MEHRVKGGIAFAVYVGLGLYGFEAVWCANLASTVSSAAGTAGDAETLRIHVGTRLQIVERADSVPRLDASRSVTARIPPPHFFAIRSVMMSEDFSELNRVEHKADIAIAREPLAVFLVSRLVPATHAIGLNFGMAADVKNRRRGFG